MVHQEGLLLDAEEERRDTLLLFLLVLLQLPIPMPADLTLSVLLLIPFLPLLSPRPVPLLEGPYAGKKAGLLALPFTHPRSAQALTDAVQSHQVEVEVEGLRRCLSLVFPPLQGRERDFFASTAAATASLTTVKHDPWRSTAQAARSAFGPPVLEGLGLLSR